jgi:hypothetical protein
MTNFSAMTKGEIKAFVQDKYRVGLDMTDTKDEMISAADLIEHDYDAEIKANKRNKKSKSDTATDPAPAPKKKSDGKGIQNPAPTHGYMDGDNGILLWRVFEDGWIPKPWTDTPAHCKNPKGERVRVLD